jgi:hypothetical protein
MTSVSYELRNMALVFRREERALSLFFYFVVVVAVVFFLRRRERGRERERRTKGSDDEGGKKNKIPAAGRSFPPTVSSLSPMGLVSLPRPHNLFAWRQFLSPASLPPSFLLPRSKASLQRLVLDGEREGDWKI